jgi:hypothetical protein
MKFHETFSDVCIRNDRTHPPRELGDITLQTRDEMLEFALSLRNRRFLVAKPHLLLRWTYEYG